MADTPTIHEYTEDRKLIDHRLTVIENSLIKLTELVYDLHAKDAASKERAETTKVTISATDRIAWFVLTTIMSLGTALVVLQLRGNK